ncbi:McrB family protein [Empedobacter stercoris]|uniref:McrB family protein n=1 Tax=Empedobacter stercoris TaxID=1628248 RepID=UPI0039EB9F76
MYKELQEEVYNWLKEKNKKDKNFTFSVRQKANKGAELNYFIGTEKSNYFSTTFWFIPVSYPGSSSDLINLVFDLKKGKIEFYIQFNQTKNPSDNQNKCDLILVQKIKERLKDKFKRVYYSDEKAKMEFFGIYSTTDYDTFDELENDLENLLDRVIPIIDEEIIKIKSENPDFIAHRFTPEEQSKMLNKMDERFKKYKIIEELTDDLFEEENELIDIDFCREYTSPLNQILYGPPGTGKTYSLKQKFFDLFTIKENSLSRDQFLNELVKPLSWWQVITIVLLDINKARVTEIYDHELIKIKESQSSSKTIVPTIWGQLQAHTIKECQNVNVEKRQNPLYFSKDENSNWTIDFQLVNELYPEILKIYNSFKRFNPSPDKLIKNYEFITFHQSYSYEDFIEGIKPDLESEENDVKYKIEDGIFKRIADKAKRDPLNKYALFIDEINRGNVSQIFGELITLIEEDKRLGNEQALEVTLPYSKEKFGVPSNLYIIGTMNTADRSVEALDTALRRRFVFEEMPPQYDLDGLQKELFGFKAGKILETINLRIEKLLDRDHQIGHAYFINKDETTIIDSFYKNIIPLLQEYFFGDYGKIGLVLGSGFVKINEQKSVFALFKDYDSSQFEERESFKIIGLNDKDFNFKNAIKLLMNP